MPFLTVSGFGQYFEFWSLPGMLQRWPRYKNRSVDVDCKVHENSVAAVDPS